MSNFPKLPGFVVTHRPTQVDHKKVTHVKLDKLQNGQNIDVPLYAVPQPPKSDMFKQTKSDQSKSFSQKQYANHQGANLDEQFEPTYVKLDKQVLRFYGYFKEAVVENRIENHRVHYLIIYYFLEDKSILIVEPKKSNAGMPMGAFLNRHMVLKPDGMTPFMPGDFRVGLDVGIYGRAIRIYDADDYTRQFFTNLGEPQADAQTAPGDPFANSKVPRARPADNDLREYMEKQLGGGKVAPQKQFLDNDRKVLRFFCVSEDLPFIVNYFLADDTVEIREVHHPNDGRDSFPVFLRRRRIPFSSEVKQPGLSFIGDNYLTCDEITPGEPIISFGRAFHITGVDEYTRDYYLAMHQKEFTISCISMPEPRDPTVKQIPPYNGFGNEQDTLGYIYRLIPQKPKSDFFKAVDNDKKVLRFVAKFNTKVPEDVTRRFIISYYLADDTISVYEPAVRNSGIIEGPFLRRGQYKNVDNNNELITPSDMPIGGDIKINGFSYHLESADQYTATYLSSHFK